MPGILQIRRYILGGWSAPPPLPTDSRQLAKEVDAGRLVVVDITSFTTVKSCLAD
jgi:hypothetical protein